MKQSRWLGAALAAGAVLAAPSAASAHPSVYVTSANVIVDASDPITLTPQVRYVVSNHGFTYVLRESNGLDAGSDGDLKYRGVVGYNLIPSGWRTGKPFADVMAVGGTAAQAHATCVTPALTTETAIKAWQEDPFYNYVPFQATSAGLEDDPAQWLPVLTGAGFDVSKLDTPANAEAECERVPDSTYHAADATQTSIESYNSGLIEHTAAPLEKRIGDLEAENAALKAQVTTSNTGLTAAQAEVAKLTLEAAPLKLSLSAVKKSGAKATISGPPVRTVTVTLSITTAQAKKLKLRSTTIAKGKAKTSDAGAATLSLKPKSAIAKKLKGSFAVSAQAVAGDRVASAKGKLTR